MCKVLVSDRDVVMLCFEKASWSLLRFGVSVNLGIAFVLRSALPEFEKLIACSSSAIKFKVLICDKDLAILGFNEDAVMLGFGGASCSS